MSRTHSVQLPIPQDEGLWARSADGGADTDNLGDCVVRTALDNATSLIHELTNFKRLPSLGCPLGRPIFEGSAASVSYVQQFLDRRDLSSAEIGVEVRLDQRGSKPIG